MTDDMETKLNISASCCCCCCCVVVFLPLSFPFFFFFCFLLLLLDPLSEAVLSPESEIITMHHDALIKRHDAYPKPYTMHTFVTKLTQYSQSQQFMVFWVIQFSKLIFHLECTVQADVWFWGLCNQKGEGVRG